MYIVLSPMAKSRSIRWTVAYKGIGNEIYYPIAVCSSKETAQEIALAMTTKKTAEKNKTLKVAA